MSLGELLKEPQWKEALKGEFTKEYFKTLSKKIDEEYQTKTVFPSRENIFRAFMLTPLSKVGVLITFLDEQGKVNY